MAHSGQEPELLGLPGRQVELARVLGREVRVLVAVHDQQRDRRDPRRRLGRRDRDRVPALWADPRLQPAPGDEPAEPVLDGQVYAPHPFGAPVVPPAGTADGDHRVDPADPHQYDVVLDTESLGLPIAKNLIDLHGGTFTLKSKLRIGTEVIVTFPPERVMQALGPISANAPSIQPQSEMSSSSSMSSSSDDSSSRAKRVLFGVG